jgi:4-aminobutyrate aminotransferase
MNKKDCPQIVTPPPGPKAQAVLNRDRQFISQSYTRTYPLVIQKGEGLEVTDVDGNRFLDFTSGIGVCNTGHRHPEVTAAIVDQTEKFLHMSGTDFYYAAQSDLAERLARLSPGTKERKVFYANSGAEAIEAAFKLARYHTRRQRVISFFGAFHGRTLGAMSLSASKAIHKEGFAPVIPGVCHIPYAYCYRCAYNLTYPECDVYCVDWIRRDLFQRSVPPTEVAAVFVEPIQGEGGYIVPPKAFHEKLQTLCRDYDILYIADEIQSGMGRTGKMFAAEHFGVDPDIITVAKGIASGMPLGAMISKVEIMDWVPGSHASTFGGNPVSCRAALATLDLLEGGLLENATVQGAYFSEKLAEMKTRRRLIGDVRGIGLMQAVELVTDPAHKTRAAAERNRAVELAFTKGLLLLGCGENTIRFIPALTVTQSQIDTALSLFEETLEEIEAGAQHG